jgi:glycosyltransferase involved in cell wall biosynthesis
MVYNIAHIGLLSPIKGITLFNRLAHDVKANWFVIGDLEAYEVLDWSNITITGNYHSFNELWDLVDYYGIDFVVSLSMGPESFSYTLSECWKMGLPVIGTNLGAIGRRISETGGITVDPYNYESIRLLLQNITDETLESLYNTIPSVKSKREMINQYEEIYVRLNRR